MRSAWSGWTQSPPPGGGLDLLCTLWLFIGEVGWAGLGLGGLGWSWSWGAWWRLKHLPCVPPTAPVHSMAAALRTFILLHLLTAAALDLDSDQGIAIQYLIFFLFFKFCFPCMVLVVLVAMTITVFAVLSLVSLESKFPPRRTATLCLCARLCAVRLCDSVAQQRSPPLPGEGDQWVFPGSGFPGILESRVFLPPPQNNAKLLQRGV